MTNQVVHFEILGPDGAGLRDFYGGMFDWSFGPPMEGMDYALTDPAVTGVGGGIGVTPDGSAMVTVYIAVDDPEAALQRAVALGGRIVAPVTTIPGVVTFAQFADPQGNVVGVVGNAMPPSA